MTKPEKNNRKYKNILKLQIVLKKCEFMLKPQKFPMCFSAQKYPRIFGAVRCFFSLDLFFENARNKSLKYVYWHMYVHWTKSSYLLAGWRQNGRSLGCGERSPSATGSKLNWDHPHTQACEKRKHYHPKLKQDMISISIQSITYRRMFLPFRWTPLPSMPSADSKSSSMFWTYGSKDKLVELLKHDLFYKFRCQINQFTQL